MNRRHESPLRRVNPSGKIRWVARYTKRDGTRASAGTFGLQREAQAAIDAAYEREYGIDLGPEFSEQVREYAATWLQRHPRSDSTDLSYQLRIKKVLEVKLGGRPLGDWRMDEVRPREMIDLLDHMLRIEGRAAAGAKGVLATLSAMWVDAIMDSRATFNPVRDVKIRKNDPRVQKPPRKIQVWSWEQMHAMADQARTPYGRAMIRVLADTGLRLGEMLALERQDLRVDGCDPLLCRAGAIPHLHVERTASDGIVKLGTKSSRGPHTGRVAPLPAGLEMILRELPARLDSRVLLPGARGRVMQNRLFYTEIWYPARKRVTGMELARPHEFRHSWVSYMRAALVDVADLADAAGHTVQTASRSYTHSLGASFEAMRQAIS